MRIRQETTPSYAAQNFLLNGITTEAKAHGFPPHTPFAFFLYDSANVVKGGIKGSNFYGSLYIDYIYVEGALRGQGYGRMLLEKAEAWAIDQRCTFATLTTMSFEAKNFYLKCGYSIEFEQKGYINSASMIYFRKNLHHPLPEDEKNIIKEAGSHHLEA
jgi:GNAT superfamily N-acetyltransferase